MWAPKRRRVEVESDGRYTALARDAHGYFSGLAQGLSAGSRYRFRLDGERSYPDPASRYQPDGPHGASQVIDPSLFRWTDAAWRGLEPARQVLYELHIGTFTREGTYAAAADRLGDLADLGATAVEIMPLAEFAGSFGWGYDGVDWFAPYHRYGSNDDFRAFVNRAHELGLGVILDVVYNHVGPDGNYLREFADAYFSARHRTDWGDAINFDDDNNEGARELVLSNVRHWIDEYHLDGLRLDATHAIYDDSPRHILQDIGAAARDAAGAPPTPRSVVVFAETQTQDARIVRDYGLDYIWCDDFHHLALVAATGKREAYYTDYGGTPQEFVSAVKRGPLYQGQHHRWQDKRWGGPAWDVA
ncbi:MAG TPA: alpha-amylase family glycosyl hydrolase, partial [Gemmatimonadales bacterium]|nr:alpha-amylase family glycosyl hydrolase [Gemmatimonadales bacterium]